MPRKIVGPRRSPPLAGRDGTDHRSQGVVQGSAGKPLSEGPR